MEDLPLFPMHDDRGFDRGPSTYTVLELNQAIGAALSEAFPGEVWVRGEIQGLARTRMRPHWYFELVEKKADRDEIAARLSVALLSWNRSAVQRDMKAAPGFDLQDNVEVRIRGRVGYYAPFGKLQLEMTGVDPAFTLGQLAASRERILRALAAEKLLERNRQLPLSPVPLRVGLITSVGSAAYNDFVQELTRSGFGFSVRVIDARVQGAETEPTVVAALRTFARLRPDAVVIVRGGGSRSDLAWFDSEAIARRIAAMPVPVLTGIGHEIDRSVADEVAHQAFKTPTACADFLADRVRLFHESVEDAGARVVTLARARLGFEQDALLRRAREAGHQARAAVRGRAQQLAHAAGRLRREAPRTLEHRSQRLSAHGGEIKAAGRLRLAQHWGRIAAARRALAAPRLLRPLLAQGQRTDGAARRVRRLAAQWTRAHALRVAAIDARVRALDPRRVLARGFTLTHHADGTLLRSTVHARVGEEILTTFHDGTARSRVSHSQPHPEGDAT